MVKIKSVKEEWFYRVCRDGIWATGSASLEKAKKQAIDMRINDPHSNFTIVKAKTIYKILKG